MARKCTETVTIATEPCLRPLSIIILKYPVTRSVSAKWTRSSNWNLCQVDRWYTECWLRRKRAGTWRPFRLTSQCRTTASRATPVAKRRGTPLRWRGAAALLRTPPNPKGYVWTDLICSASFLSFPFRLKQTLLKLWKTELCIIIYCGDVTVAWWGSP